MTTTPYDWQPFDEAIVGLEKRLTSLPAAATIEERRRTLAATLQQLPQRLDGFDRPTAWIDRRRRWEQRARRAEARNARLAAAIRGRRRRRAWARIARWLRRLTSILGRP